MKQRWILTLLIIVILVLALLDPGVSWWLQRRLGGTRAPASDLQDLRLQNESLRSELAKLQDMQRQLPVWSARFSAAPIFASYPFNLKNELLIGIGGASGVTANQPAMVYVSKSVFDTATSSEQAKIFIGRVDRTFPDASIVKTIFDSQWRSLVRIGPKGTEGLLLGGSKPRITLISKDASVLSGDAVFNADPRFPYGSPIGQVNEVQITTDRTSQEATLQFSYSLSDFDSLLILTNYNAPPIKDDQ